MFYEMNKAKAAYVDWPKEKHYISAQRSYDDAVVKIPVLHDNVLIVGKTGYGKTTLTKAYVDPLLNDSNEPYSVFFEIKNDFRDDFFRPEDKMVSYSAGICSEENLFQWNLVREIRQSDDWDTELEELVTILFKDLLDEPRNRIWADGAKDTFKGFVNVILHCYKNCPSNKVLIDGMRYMDRLQFLKHLAKYKPNRSLLRDYFEYDPEHHESYVLPRKGSDIMFFLQNVLGKFGGTFMSSNGTDTIHDYLKGIYGKRLFLIYDYQKKDSSNLFFRYFLNKIISERLSQKVDRTKKVLLVLDEIAELEQDFGLMHAVTLGRGNNLQVILSTQSIEKLYCVAPTLHSEHITNAMFAGFPVLVSFLPGDSQTIEMFQKLYGNRQRQIMTVPISRYADSVVKIETEPIVRYEDFASLDIGECYIKIRSAEPERVKIMI